MRTTLCFLLLSLAEAFAQSIGSVRANGRPVPGAVVTANLGQNKFDTTTDELGRYELPLTPGDWTLTVQMFGFGTATQVRKVPETAPAQWSLQLLAATQTPVQTAGLALPDLPTAEAPPAMGPADSSGDNNEAFLLNGSLSRGLASAPAEGPPEFGPPGGPGMGGPGGMRPDGMEGGPPGGGLGMGGPGFGGPGMGPGGGGRGGGFGGGGRGGGPGGGRPLGPAGRAAIRQRLEQMRNSTVGNRRRRNNNGVRGALSFQARNADWNARPYSLTGLEYPRPDQAQYRFNGVSGGPLKIPKLILSDNTFFTLTYNLTYGRNPFNGVATVPTALERGGDFSASRTNVP
ncbi:MAG: hypothetical protein B7X34_02025, partial [Acidobacteriia bacterium 12-62-4]